MWKRSLGFRATLQGKTWTGRGRRVPRLGASSASLLPPLPPSLGLAQASRAVSQILHARSRSRQTAAAVGRADGRTDKGQVLFALARPPEFISSSASVFELARAFTARVGRALDIHSWKRSQFKHQISNLQVMPRQIHGTVKLQKYTKARPFVL